MAWKDYKIPLLLLLAGLLLTGVATYYTLKRDNESIRLQLVSDIERYSTYLRAETERSLSLLTTLRGFLGAINIDRKVFFNIGQDALDSYPQLESIVWVPRVDAAQRQAYEQAEQVFSKGFEFREWVDGRFRKASERAYYYPVYYQLGGIDRDGMGLDLSAGRLGEHLDLIRDLGGEHMAVDMSPSFGDLLAGGDDPEHFLVVILPVYEWESETIVDRREAFKGFLIAGIHVMSLMDNYIHPERYRHIDYYVADVTSPDTTIIVNLHEDEVNPAARILDEYEYVHDFDIIGGRIWEVVAAPTRAYVKLLAISRWQSAALTGCLLSVMVAGYVLTLRARAYQVNLLVRKRTAELRTANHKLELLSRTDALTPRLICSTHE